MEARKEGPGGGLQPSFGLEVENLLKAIDAVEGLLNKDGELGAVKLVDASNQIKQITATMQALAKLPESRTPANTATAAQLRHKTKHLVLWVKQLKLQHDQQQATNNAGAPASPGQVVASPLSALGHLPPATRRTASLPQPPTAAAAPSNTTTSTQSGVHSTLASSSTSSSSSSRPIRAATTSSPTTSPTLLIRNEFNLFSDTFSMPSARSSESTSFAPRSYLSGGDSDDPLPASSSPYAPPHLKLQQQQQQDKMRYREGDESMRPRHSAKEEGDETESGTNEELFTPSSPPADSTFYLIDAKGPGKDVHIPQHEGGDGGGKGRRDRSTSNHVKAGRMNGPAGARNPLCGWLHKSGNTFMSPWKRRYFVLDASERPLAVQQYSGFMTWGGGERRHNKTAPPAMKQTLRLYYYISKEDPVPKGFIDLALLEAIRPGVRYKNTFDITVANKVFHLKAETKEEADEWIWELRRWAEWARGRELAPNAREQQEERERKEKEEQDKQAAASFRNRSASFPAEWFPKLTDALLGKSEAAVAPAPTAAGEEKKEEPRRRAETEDKYKHGVATAADARAKEVDTATQYEAKLQLMEEVVEYKERELWNMRREAEKRTGLNIDDCSVEELEELESELLKALVRIKTVKKKKAKEVRDSIKMDLLQLDVCRACFVNTRRVVFLPCGHFEVCEYCAEKASECHRCNRPIERRVEFREDTEIAFCA